MAVGGADGRAAGGRKAGRQTAAARSRATLAVPHSFTSLLSRLPPLYHTPAVPHHAVPHPHPCRCPGPPAADGCSLPPGAGGPPRPRHQPRPPAGAAAGTCSRGAPGAAVALARRRQTGADAPSAAPLPNLCPAPLPHPQAAPNVTAFDHTGGSSIASAVAPWLPKGLFSGDGTAFSEAVPNTGKGFACSFRYLNDWASVHFAAINKPMVGDGAVEQGWVLGRLGAGAGGWRLMLAQQGCWHSKRTQQRTRPPSCLHASCSGTTAPRAGAASPPGAWTSAAPRATSGCR